MIETADELMLEPSKIYPQLKESLHQNATEYFDELIEKSQINVDTNQTICKRYYQKKQAVDDLKKKIKSSRTKKTFFIVFGIISLVIALIGLFASLLVEEKKYIPILIGVLFGALGLFLLIFGNVRYSKMTDNLQKKLAKLEKELKAIYDEAAKSVAPLVALFDWGMPQEVITKTTPLIQLDKYLDIKKYDYMVKKYGLLPNRNKKSSVFCLQSGSILGNPFFLERDFEQVDGYKTYTGSRTITWTTWSRDSQGHSHATTHTQTLVATVSKPCPYYGFKTYLIYCNDAAPDLSFSRVPTVDIKATDKDLEKFVKKCDKELDKLAEKSITDKDPHTNFLKMNNPEFEAFFHAWDRDNETEFRLLFTPLAQLNMVHLLKQKEPYGDDFRFDKMKRINKIESVHDQNLDYESDPKVFTDINVVKMKNTFVQYTETFFQSLFFDFAPLLSIPLYQQMKPIEYIYPGYFDSNVSYYEQEVSANAFSQDLVKPVGAATPCILKTNFLNKEGEYDDVQIEAYSFRAVPHVEMVRKMGGDGRPHEIPVQWIEYVPIERKTPMKVRHVDMSLQKFRQENSNQNFSAVFRNQIEAILNR